MSDLTTFIGRVQIRNPLILAAGILGSTFSTLNRAYQEGFGAVVTKSVGRHPRDGHPNPSVVYIPETDSILNAVGLANPGCIEFGKELVKIHSDVKLIVSIFGSTAEDISSVIQCIENNIGNSKSVAFELNLSCPHVQKVGMLVGTDPKLVYDIVNQAKSITKTAIWIKLTPNVKDITIIGEAAIDAGADALVAINTLKAMLINVEARKPILANLRGGLSGRAIKPIGIRAIYDLYEKFGPKVPLIGVGGIWTWEDIVEYFLAGACSVQIGSVLSQYSSPQFIISELLTGLQKYLVQEGLSLHELRGLAHE
ncbi:MAG: dihydroorotate dehydrogenase [Candidatus Heimdallarchaeota archaeon]|nr:MAG: dihydroorotate dehydrogenase [Candidatus Heimdallarchaeota archaeon]